MQIGGALHLPTRKLDAACPDHCLQIVIELFQVTVHHGELCGTIDLIVRPVQPQQKIVAQGIAEETRYLCRIRAARWHEEIARGRNMFVIPADLARTRQVTTQVMRRSAVLPEPIRPVTTVRVPRLRRRLTPSMPFVELG